MALSARRPFGAHIHFQTLFLPSVAVPNASKRRSAFGGGSEIPQVDLNNDNVNVALSVANFFRVTHN